MKKVMFLVFFIISIPLGYAEESKHPFSDHIEGLWAQGKTGMDEVKEIAEERLLDNPEDIFGLVIMFAYQLEFAQLGKLDSTGGKLLFSGGKIKNTKFIESFYVVKQSVEIVLKFKDNITKEMLERDKKLNGLAGHTLVNIEIIRICEEEGLISASDLERQDSSDYILFFVLALIVLIVLMIYLYQRKRRNKEISIPKHHDESV